MNQSIRVLLIEDNQGDARLVKEELASTPSSMSFQLEWIDRLEKGLAFLRANAVQAVLLDLSLPDSEGPDTLQKVLSCVPHIPVIVMTGTADEDLAARALQVGAQDYLVKGEVDGRLLARVIRYAIQRKQTELQLAEALEFNQHIVTSSPIGILTYRLTGECLSANAAAAQMVGGTVKQLERQNFRELESWKRSGLYVLVEQAITSKELVAADIHILTTFGKEAWYGAQSVTFKSGGEEHLLLILSDITERKRVEEALRDNEARYRLATRATNDVIWEWNSKNNQLTWTENAQPVFGYSPEEAGPVASWWDDHVHPEDRLHVISSLNAALAGNETIWSGEYRFLRKDGSYACIRDHAYIERDPAGQAIRMVGAMADVTERKQAEQAMKEKERLLSEAQRIGRLGSWSYHIPSDSMKFSDEMYRLLDIFPDEFHHNSADFLALVYPSDRDLAAKWMADMKEGRQAKGLDFRIFHKNGELCYLHCTGVLEFAADGKPAQFIGTTQDVTEGKLAEIQIKQQIKRLTALSEIDRAILSSFDQSHILGVILSQAISQLQVDAAAILLLDSEGELLRYAAGQGFRTPLVEGAHLHMGEKYAGRVAKESRTIRIPDLRETGINQPFSAFVQAEHFVSYIGVPLIVKGKVKGVLEVFHRTLLQPYQEWLDFFNTLAGQAAIAIENTTLFGTLRFTNQELLQAYDATIEGWSRAMDLRDRETSGHTQRVTTLTLELSRAMGLENSRMVHIRRGALLHDIGKLGVPDQILFKPGAFTREEWEIMQQHTDFAYQMLSQIQYLKPALTIPYFHHEKWDGTGYPLGLKGEQIPLEARIFAIVDVWDALQSDRPYRKAYPRQEAIEVIRSQSGSHFDPRVVECFLELVSKTE